MRCLLGHICAGQCRSARPNLWRLKRLRDSGLKACDVLKCNARFQWEVYRSESQHALEALADEESLHTFSYQPGHSKLGEQIIASSHDLFVDLLPLV